MTSMSNTKLEAIWIPRYHCQLLKSLFIFGWSQVQDLKFFPIQETFQVLEFWQVCCVANNKHFWEQLLIKIDGQKLSLNGAEDASKMDMYKVFLGSCNAHDDQLAMVRGSLWQIMSKEWTQVQKRPSPLLSYIKPILGPIPSLFLASRKWWVPEDKKSAGKEKNPGGQPILVISWTYYLWPVNRENDHGQLVFLFFLQECFFKKGACSTTLGLCDTKNGLIGIVNSNNFAAEKVIFCLQSPALSRTLFLI